MTAFSDGSPDTDVHRFLFDEAIDPTASEP
jgi:hypothetical protein